MRLFLTLHLTAIILCVAVALFFLIPESQLPRVLAGPVAQARASALVPLAARLEPGAPLSREAVQVSVRIVREDYEDRIAVLKRKRDELRDRLKQLDSAATAGKARRP